MYFCLYNLKFPSLETICQIVPHSYWKKNELNFVIYIHVQLSVIWNDFDCRKLFVLQQMSCPHRNLNSKNVLMNCEKKSRERKVYDIV